MFPNLMTKTTNVSARTAAFSALLSSMTNEEAMKNSRVSSYITKSAKVYARMKKFPDKNVAGDALRFAVQSFRGRTHTHAAKQQKLLQSLSGASPAMRFCIEVHYEKLGGHIGNPRVSVSADGRRRGKQCGGQQETYFTVGNLALQAIQKSPTVLRAIYDALETGLRFDCMDNDELIHPVPVFKDDVAISEIVAMFKKIGFTHRHILEKDCLKEVYYFERSCALLDRERAKPCPFCGNEVIRLRVSENDDGTGYFAAFCEKCGASSRDVLGKVENRDRLIDEVIFLWNQRIAES